MKRSVLFSLIVLTLFSKNSFSQSTGQICFIRPGGFQGSAINYRVFIDDSLVCKLKSKSHSMHTVTAGEHTVAGQVKGLSLDKGSTPLKVEIKPGKTTYISIVGVSNKAMCQEITENSATEQLKKSKPSNCSDK